MEAFVLEFKEMKDCINQLKKDVESINQLKKDVESINQLKKDVESINQLKKDVESLTNMYNDNMEEMREVKKENIALQQQVQLLQREDDESKQSALSKQSIDSSNEDIIALDKKVESRCSKVERSITIFTKEFERGMTKIQEESCQLGRHQRVLSVLHVSLQAKKDLGNEVKSLKTEVEALKEAGPMQHQRHIPPLPVIATPPKGAVGGKHPSKKAISKAEATAMTIQIRENIKRSSSSVFLYNMPLAYNVPVYVDGYTKVTTACDFMDPESGVYTVPLQGDYKLYVEFRNDNNKQVYLCTDRDEKRWEIKSGYNQYNNRYFTPVCWSFEAGDKIWLEVTGKSKVAVNKAFDIRFDVIKMYPDTSTSA